MIVDAVSGLGRMGRVGLVSTLKERIMEETEAGVCWPLPWLAWWCARARKGEVGDGPRARRIV